MSNPVDPTIDSQNVITPNPSTTSSTRHSSRKAVLCPTLLLIVSLGLFALYARSYTYLNQDLGTWGCRMSWMAPNYVKMDGPEVEGGLGRKYGVFLYREGGLQGDIRPRGKPILFIPGNAGSSKQVRSMASSAAHLYRHEVQQRHQGNVQDGNSDIGLPEREWEEIKRVEQEGWDELDFFTVDFNEEFSALHPGSIRDQAEYVSHVIPWILSLYSSTGGSSSEVNEDDQELILVGHSMGGVVARLSVKLISDRLSSSVAESLDHPDERTHERTIKTGVKGIITMSTPHALPPVSIDRGMEKVYDEIEEFWARGFGIGRGERPVLISICGGTADTQIASDGCALPRYPSVYPQEDEDDVSREIVEDKGTFSVFTTGIHGVWTGVDHQAMVWCDQVRTRVAKVLLGMQARPRRGGPSEERKRMTGIARRELLGDVTDRLKGGRGGRIKPENDVVLIDKDRPIIQGKGRRKISCPLADSKGCVVELMGEFRVRGVGPEEKALMEVYAPDQGARTWIPTDLRGIEILPPSAPFESNAQPTAFPLPSEGVRSDEGLTYVNLEVVGDIIVDMDESGWAVVGMYVVGKDIGWRPIWRSWWFNRLDHALLAQRVTLERREESGCSGNFAPIIRHRTHPNNRFGETHEARYYPRATGTILLHSHTATSPFISSANDEGITIELFQDPRDMCRIETASLQVDWSATPGLSVLRYRTTLIAWGMGWLALVWAKQMRTFRRTGIYPAFQFAFKDVLVDDALLWVVGILGASCLQASQLKNLVDHPEQYLLGNTSWALVLNLLPGVILSLGLVWVTHLGVGMAVWIWSNTMARFTANSKPVREDGKLLLKRRIVAMAGLFLILWTLMPYQFAFVIIFVIHFGTTAGTRSEEYHQYHSLFLAMVWLLPLNAPTVLVWARGIALDWRHASRFGSKRGLIQVVGFTLLGEGCAGGKAYARRGASLSYLGEGGLMVLAAYSFLCGPRFTYGIEIIANVLACCLVAQMYQPNQRV